MSIISFLQSNYVPLFYLLLFLVLYINRKKFQVESKIIFMYRTKIGLKLMDRFAKSPGEEADRIGKPALYISSAVLVLTFLLMIRQIIIENVLGMELPGFLSFTSEVDQIITIIFGASFLVMMASILVFRQIKPASILGIYVGYVFAALICFTIIRYAWQVLVDPATKSTFTPAIPGVSIAGIPFPLIIGWITLFIIIVVHEFSHGVVARAFDIPIKNSGIVFIGPILGAFVEPDQAKMSKKPAYQQLAVFAAGPFSNILLTILAFGLIPILITPLYTSMTTVEGVVIQPIPNDTLPLYMAGVQNESVMNAINGVQLTDYAILDRELGKLVPGQDVNLTIDDKEYVVTTIPNPTNESKAYIGFVPVSMDFRLIEDTPMNRVLRSVLEWVQELLWWIGFISINVGVFNLFPIFITDGARMLQINFERMYKKDRKFGLEIWKIMNFGFLFLLLLTMILPYLRTLIGLVAGLIA